MAKPFTVNINRFDPYKTLPLPGLLRHVAPRRSPPSARSAR